MVPQPNQKLWARRPVSSSVISWLCDLESIPFNHIFSFCKMKFFGKVSLKSLLILKLYWYLSLTHFMDFTIPYPSKCQGQAKKFMCLLNTCYSLINLCHNSRNSSCCTGSVSLSNLSKFPQLLIDGVKIWCPEFQREARHEGTHLYFLLLGGWRRKLVSLKLTWATERPCLKQSKNNNNNKFPKRLTLKPALYFQHLSGSMQTCF